jgi:SEC-C motif-containing protein
MDLCPCGSQIEYRVCCGPFLEGSAIPSTPLLLMRSRYTAFTRLDTIYIGNTQKKFAAKDYDPEGTADWAKRCEWLGLSILDASEISDKDTAGTVEFIVHFKENGVEKNIHEKSQFEKIQDRWYYTKGSHKTTNVSIPGRNDPCNCGSGIKYKKCCGA